MTNAKQLADSGGDNMSTTHFLKGYLIIEIVAMAIRRAVAAVLRHSCHDDEVCR